MKIQNAIRAANSMKNMIAYAPNNLTYSTFFAPAKENLLLAAHHSDSVNSKILVHNKMQPFVMVSPAHIGFFRRPAFNSGFLSCQDIIRHLSTPVLMLLVASIEAAKALLNALLLFPYHLVLGVSNLLRGQFKKGSANFQTVVGVLLITAYWMLSALIDPFLELISCVTRAVTTCIYGWGNINAIKEAEFNALYTLIKKHTIKQLRACLTTNPFFLAAVQSLSAKANQFFAEHKHLLKQLTTSTARAEITPLIELFTETIKKYPRNSAACPNLLKLIQKKLKAHLFTRNHMGQGIDTAAGARLRAAIPEQAMSYLKQFLFISNKKFTRSFDSVAIQCLEPIQEIILSFTRTKTGDNTPLVTALSTILFPEFLSLLDLISEPAEALIPLIPYFIFAVTCVAKDTPENLFFRGLNGIISTLQEMSKSLAFTRANLSELMLDTHRQIDMASDFFSDLDAETHAIPTPSS